eukprot:SAG31_NODE_13139_length_890_cov_1.671302_2_plen_101_part_00
MQLIQLFSLSRNYRLRAKAFRRWCEGVQQAQAEYKEVETDWRVASLQAQVQDQEAALQEKEAQLAETSPIERSLRNGYEEQQYRRTFCRLSLLICCCRQL